MNYYPFNIGDYAKHTKYLSMVQDLAYRRLIDLYYVTEGPIAANVEDIAESIGLVDHIQDVSKVLSKFFLISEGFYRNTRCDEVIAEYHAKADRAKGANKSRWKNNKSDSSMKSDTKSDVKSEQCRIPNNNQEPITNNQVKEESKDFAVLPSATGSKKSARKAIKTRMPENFCLSDGVRRWAAEKGHDRLEAHFESFVMFVEQHGYVYANWDAALKTAIRCNWAKLEKSVAGRGSSPKVEKTKEQQRSDEIDGLRHMATLGNQDAKAKLQQMGMTA